MRILNAATGSTEYRNVKVQSRAAKLVFQVTSATNAYDVILLNLLLSITKVGADGEKIMMNRQPALIGAEQCAYAEGYIFVEDLGGGTTRVTFTYDLANEGSLAFDNDTYMTIDLEGLLAADIVSVNSIDVPETDPNFNMQDNILIQGATKDIDLSGAYGVVFPIGSSGIDRVQIDFKAAEGKPAKSMNYTIDELKAIGRDTNDLVYAGDVVKYGCVTVVRMDLKDAVSMQIVTNTNNAFYVYVLREKPF